MKVIDLLNKIANLEEVPKKIRYCSDLYEIDYRYMDYKNKYINDTYLLRDVISSSEELCNKIEVVEEVLEDTPKEDNKIEKFKVIKNNSGDSVELIYDGMKLELTLLQAIILDKLNEIINKVNGR